MNHPRFSTFTSAVLLLLSFGGCLAAEQQEVKDQQEPQVSNASAQLSARDEEPELDSDTVLIGSTQLTRFRIGSANGDWLSLLQQHIPELSSSSEAQSLTPGVLLKLRTAIASILSTEGYFSPLIRFEKLAENAAVIQINIDAGQRSVVQDVNLKFSGALADAANTGQAQAVKRRDSVIASWSLPRAAPFRDDDWVRAKNQLTENLRSESYAAASIGDSSATIDVENHSATLALEIDSGPPFTLGEMNITGLQRYPPWLLNRYNPPKKGEPYSRTRLLEYQRFLQNSAYFSTVAISVDPDPTKADAVPVEVNVVERQSRDLALGVGYSTNTGFRTEVTYRDRNVLEKAWDLRSAIRIEQKRQLAYADMYFPPRESDQLDSFGVLVDHSNVAGLRQSRSAVGVKRSTTRAHLEQRLGVNLTLESTQLNGEAQHFRRALVGTVGWTWRDVDDSFAPRKGQIAQIDFAISEKALVSDQRFIRVVGKYQRWIPVGLRDNLLLRAELGQMFSQGSEGIPEDYLFRTGGSTTVRGYTYQSLGVQHPGGVTGGRVMAVASAEYVHWLNPTWGSAVFMDLGDAADSWREHSAKQAFGVGARYKTPAGPIALDLAYAKQVQKFRLDFSIAIAF